MTKFMDLLQGRYNFNKKSNNRKETRGRVYRKQYAPAYSQKALNEMKEEGLPSYYIEQCARRKKLVLHEAN